ncbi:hypothetical protein [Allorhizobium ampelinum]|uniref:hypothetical protein n=1 Tax=Allorhizobium ampelinum TaxID=3025782 RepID=UPI000B3FAA4D|nr:hypothetical protein [Allorhizobium ampelinum]NTA27421.1 hypothetical protein [Allorhizobium ampelinum]OVE94478.1 hypothetical protein B7W85_13075 [Allorhizobium ampelinum]
MTKYAEIIKRLEEATGLDTSIDGAIALWQGWTFEKRKGDNSRYWRKPGVTEYYNRSELPNYTASIDTSISLVERMLPSEWFDLGGGINEGQWECNIHTDYIEVQEIKPTAPLAILLALFRVLEAKEPQ